ncbi:methyltransferase [Hydrogenimonas sp. SS33]|uniref:methyltransferase n=1 Tax=Hydrogenimonas leucolamina TaxID=2954236 RepID=UPI00336BCD1F
MHTTQFRRHARTYPRYNLIQKRVARALLEKIPRTYRRIVDLGCGNGVLYHAYERPFISYLAVDAAPEMVALHPSGPGVEKMVGDFNDPALFEALKKRRFDLLLSSSSLQWAADLEFTLASLASLQKPTALTLFTAGTFATLHRTAGVTSPIRSRVETVEALRRHIGGEIDILKYELYFRDTLSMLRYIKRSGVSGGERQLGYKETKRILETYPLSYLEFEVVRCIAIH